MSRDKHRLLVSIGFSLALIAGTMLLTGAKVMAQCSEPELISGLQVPLGITRSEKGKLFVSESGTSVPNTGRISIVDRDGNRRTLLDGLPSGINDVNEISGPAGIFIHENNLYVLIGIGDAIDPGPFPGTALPNPSPASPLFSSVLAIHFSSYVERKTSGFTLTAADHEALASGEKLRKSNGGSDRITVELIANFPDFFAEPLAVPNVPDNVRGSNPFDLVLVEGHRRYHGDNRWNDDDHHDRDKNADLIYVTDGGRNLVWRVDMESGGFSILAVFPQVPNTLLLPNFPRFIDAVPTGIAESRGQLLVTLFRGAPFPPGASNVERVNPLTGNPTPFITGLKTAIDVLPIRKRYDTDHLVLQHASAGPFFGSPGHLLRFETPTGPPAVLSACLTRPTSMTLDRETGTLYVTELVPVPPPLRVELGRIVTIHLVP